MQRLLPLGQFALANIPQQQQQQAKNHVCLQIEHYVVLLNWFTIKRKVNTPRTVGMHVVRFQGALSHHTAYSTQPVPPIRTARPCSSASVLAVQTVHTGAHGAGSHGYCWILLVILLLLECLYGTPPPGWLPKKKLLE